MRTYALDTETDYSKDYSVSEMDVWHYVNDPRFNCYMLTVCGDDGFEYAGKPEDFDWSLLDGEEVTLVSHNRAFDKHVVERLVELGKIPAFKPGAWWCSADCASYHGLPRALAGVCEHLFNIKPDKSVRDKMKGKDAGNLSEADAKELTNYAIEDARLCLKVWQTLSPTWPEHEHWLSAHTGDIGVRGLPVDIEALDAGIRHLNEVQITSEMKIPWADEAPPLSHKQLAIACREAGIEPPSSLAKDSEVCAAWEDKYGEQFPWVGAMRDYRRSNTLKAKLETMRARVRHDTGWSAFSLKYFGASTTGRWSGGGGWNVQNLGKGPILGVDMRSIIKAPPGKTFVVCDLSQIEPRVLAVCAGNRKLLDAVRNGYGTYEAHAVGYGIWNGEKGTLKKSNPKLYAASKAQVLALGYSAGPGRFMSMSPILTGGEYCPDAVESERAVMDFRARNPEITNLWRKLNDGLQRSINQDFELELPSRRVMRYRKITSVGGLTGLTVRGGKFMRTKLYGGLLCLSADTEVLTRDGWCKIMEVGCREVWDGEEWVCHTGLAYKGNKPTIERFGVRATPDHKFLTDKGWTPLVGCDTTLSYDNTFTPQTPVRPTHLAAQEPAGEHLRGTHCDRMRRDRREENAVAMSLLVREHSSETKQRAFPWNKTERAYALRALVPYFETAPAARNVHPRDVETPGLLRLEVYERSVRATVPPVLAQLRRAWDHGVPGVARIFRELLGGHGANLPGEPGPGPDQQRPRLLQAKLPMGYEEHQLPEQAGQHREEVQPAAGLPGAGIGKGDQTINSGVSAEQRVAVGENPEHPGELLEPVFDLLNCGPRNRFVVRGGPGLPVLTAHNCENLCQGTARDVFGFHMKLLHAEGLDIMWHVHDEVILLEDEDKAEETLARALEIMSIPPPWMPSIPLAAEGEITPIYKK